MESLLRQPAMMAAVILAASAAVTDLKTRTIPNELVFAGGAAGLGLNVWMSGGTGFVRALLGGIAGFCIFLPFFLLRGMGGGDVKLMAALGVCFGPIAIIQTALVASMAGAVLALIAAARHGVVRRTLTNTGKLLGSWLRHGPRASEEMSLDNPKALKIPYALPIAAGALFIAFSG